MLATDHSQNAGNRMPQTADAPGELKGPCSRILFESGLIHSVKPRPARLLEFGELRNYAGAPPRAPGRGGVTSGATTTCLGGFSGGIFLPGGGAAPGGGLIRRPCSTISLICEPSRVSNSSSAFAIVSRVSRFAVSVVFAS